jgi:hypothetical protein
MRARALRTAATSFLASILLGAASSGASDAVPAAEFSIRKVVGTVKAVWYDKEGRVKEADTSVERFQ